jgi:hypothetical protein
LLLAVCSPAFAEIAATPTPGPLPQPCGAPYPKVFKLRKEPVLKPEEPYELGGVVEPNVILGPDGLFHMTYSSNAFSKGGSYEAISLATSRDLLHWKRWGKGPILGGGKGDQPGVLGMSYQVHIKDEWRVYYKGPGNQIAYASSKDGYHYKRAGTAVQGAALAKYCGGGFDSLGMVFKDGHWWGIAEVMGNICPHWPAYMNWLFRSDDGGKTFEPMATEPLYTQRPDASKVGVRVYCGARSLVKIGNRYHVWLHIDIPTNIYHSVSTDLYNWRTDKVPAIETRGDLFGLKACNQAADTSIIEHAGKTYLFFDGTDNANRDGRIGVAIYDGTLADYDRCAPATAYVQ